MRREELRGIVDGLEPRDAQRARLRGGGAGARATAPSGAAARRSRSTIDDARARRGRALEPLPDRPRGARPGGPARPPGLGRRSRSGGRRRAESSSSSRTTAPRSAVRRSSTALAERAAELNGTFEARRDGRWIDDPARRAAVRRAAVVGSRSAIPQERNRAGMRRSLPASRAVARARPDDARCRARAAIRRSSASAIEDRRAALPTSRRSRASPLLAGLATRCAILAPRLPAGRPVALRDRLVLDVVLVGVRVDERVDLRRRSRERVVDLTNGFHLSGSASSGKIASTGHSGSQAPQSMHSSGSMMRIRSNSWMQSTGQTSTQERSLMSMQGSAMMYVTRRRV